jgi:hypothetical protein
MNRSEVEQIVDLIEFRDWQFRLGNLGDGFYLQVAFPGSDTDTGRPVFCKGRKWFISRFATQEEVVKTCWLAVEVAQRHEAMEDFKFDQVAIFHPHTGLDALCLASTYPHVTRPDVSTAIEEQGAVSSIGP